MSVIEATLEDPRQILSAQQNKARGEAVAAMKADGIEYDQRMALLDEVTYPQPLAEMLGEAFEVYRKAAPWVGDFELAPKSVVRDMYERAMNFGEFVQFYGLARSEGIVLRYLADGYKALRQTVPQDALPRGPRGPHRVARRAGPPGRLQPAGRVGGAAPPARRPTPHDAPPPPPPSLTSNIRAFRVMVRNEMFRRVELFADEAATALGELDADAGWDADAGKTRWTTTSTSTTTSAPARTPAARRC